MCVDSTIPLGIVITANFLSLTRYLEDLVEMIPVWTLNVHNKDKLNKHQLIKWILSVGADIHLHCVKVCHCEKVVNS